MEQIEDPWGNISSQTQTQGAHPLEQMPTFEQHIQDMNSRQSQEATTETETSSENTRESITAESIYRTIAKDALKSWNGLSEEEAGKISKESSYDELESKIGAHSSIDAAGRGICEALVTRGLLEKYGKEYDALEDGFFEITDFDGEYNIKHPNWAQESFNEALKIMSEKFEQVTDKEDFVLDVLDTIHDNWMDNNMDKLNDPKRTSKRYQFMPLSLIGFNEAKSDLLFVRPILEAGGMNIDEEKLETTYENYNKGAKVLFTPENRYDLDKYSIDKTIKNANPRPYEYVLRNLSFTIQKYQFENDENFTLDINNTTGEDFMIQEQRKISVGPEWGKPDRYASDWENQHAKEEAEQGWAIVTNSRIPTQYERQVRYAAEIANQVIDKLHPESKNN